MVVAHAGNMISEVVLAIEMGTVAVDIAKTIHPHLTLGKSIGTTAEVAHGRCLDLRPVKRYASGRGCAKLSLCIVKQPLGYWPNTSPIFNANLA